MLKVHASKFLKLYQAIPMLVISLMLLVSLTSIASAHGGEDHGDEQKAPITSVGQMNSQLATAGNLEVLVKYPTPKFGEETVLRVFINDRVTNAPVAGINLTLVFNYVGSLNAVGAQPAASFSANNSNVQAVVSPTDTPGVYQAAITFPDKGEYKVSLKLSSGNINEQVNVASIIVPAKGSNDIDAKSSFNVATIILLIASLIILIAAGWYIMRSRKLHQTGAETQEPVI